MYDFMLFKWSLKYNCFSHVCSFNYYITVLVLNLYFSVCSEMRKMNGLKVFQLRSIILIKSGTTQTNFQIYVNYISLLVLRGVTMQST